VITFLEQENPSYDSIKSTCDDEEVQQTEHVVKGAEGVVINKINKLSTTHMKFDGVNQVNIYLGGKGMIYMKILKKGGGSREKGGGGNEIHAPCACE
jgi:hypothetical protein